MRRRKWRRRRRRRRKPKRIGRLGEKESVIVISRFRAPLKIQAQGTSLFRSAEGDGGRRREEKEWKLGASLPFHSRSTHSLSSYSSASSSVLLFRPPLCFSQS